MSNLKLSDHDRAVLDSIFDPTQSGGQIPYFNQEALEELKDNDDSGEQTPAVLQSKKVELDGVKAAENSELERATDLFEIAMNLAPHRASPYNNRAQVYRIQGDNDGEI